MRTRRVQHAFRVLVAALGWRLVICRLHCKIVFKHYGVHTDRQKDWEKTAIQTKERFPTAVRQIENAERQLATKLGNLSLWNSKKSFFLSSTPSSGGVRNFHLEVWARRSGRRKSPSRVQGWKPRQGFWGTKFLKSWSSLQTLFTDFDSRNHQNLKISHNLPPDCWPVCFTAGAKSDPLN